MNKSIITVHSISFLTDNFHMIYINIFLFELKKRYLACLLCQYIYTLRILFPIFFRSTPILLLMNIAKTNIYF